MSMSASCRMGEHSFYVYFYFYVYARPCTMGEHVFCVYARFLYDGRACLLCSMPTAVSYNGSGFSDASEAII